MLENVADDSDRSIDQENDETGLFTGILEFWRNPPEEEDTVIVPGVAELVTNRTLPNLLNDLLYTELRTTDMTNLGNILLGYPTGIDPMHDDNKIGRLSLAHEKLSYMPKIICDEFGPFVKILDISENKIKNLDFLEHFTELTTLIADKNLINETDTNIPFMPKLELLYLNQCKIGDLYWVETLRYNCPNLKYLSLMGSYVAPSLLDGANIYEYLRYRFYVISAIPSLVHLDDKHITQDERAHAKLMYPTPLVQNFYNITKARLPHVLRKLTGRINDYFPLPESSKTSKKREKNYVI